MIVRRFASLLFIFAAIFGPAFALAAANSSQNLRIAPHSTMSSRTWTTRQENFHSLSADVERTKVTVVVNDRSTETGTILVRGDRMLLDLKTPDPRTILRNGDNLFIYGARPETRGGIQPRQESRPGGPVPAARLRHGRKRTGRRGYGITLVGENPIDDRKTVELELVSQSEDVLKQFSKDSNLVRRIQLAPSPAAVIRSRFRRLYDRPLLQDGPQSEYPRIRFQAPLAQRHRKNQALAPLLITAQRLSSVNHQDIRIAEALAKRGHALETNRGDPS